MMNAEICTHGAEGTEEASKASVVVLEGFLEEGTAGLKHEESQEAAGCVCVSGGWIPEHPQPGLRI